MTVHAETRAVSELLIGRRIRTADEAATADHRRTLDDARTLGHLDAVVTEHRGRHLPIHPRPEPGCPICLLLNALHNALNGRGGV